jgi:hypothetical protein
MAAGDEWNAAGTPERLPVDPVHQDRFRRLLTELAFSLAGAPVFGFSAAWIRPPVRGAATPWTPLSSPSEWEELFYRWMPLVLLGAAFSCLVWLVLVLWRLAELKKGRF